MNKIKYILMILLMSLSCISVADSINLTSYETDALTYSNLVRARVNASFYKNQATPNPAISLMQWDKTLAIAAKTIVEKCIWKHSGNGYGENLAINMGDSSFNGAIKLWEDEVADYNIVDNTCTGICGHYTQLVWDSTNKVGCYIMYCPTMDGLSFGGYFTACNYSPAGNWTGKKPYKYTGNKVADIYDTTKGIIFIGNIDYYDTTYDVELKAVSDMQFTISNVINSTNDKVDRKELKYIGSDLMLYVPHINVNSVDYMGYFKVDITNSNAELIYYWINK